MTATLGRRRVKKNEGENSEKGRTEDANENKKSGKNAEGEKDKKENKKLWNSRTHALS